MTKIDGQVESVLETYSGFTIYLNSKSESDLGLHELIFEMRLEAIVETSKLYTYPDHYFSRIVQITVLPCKITDLKAFPIQGFSINYDAAIEPKPFVDFE